jgi:uncharacterized membrane protein YfcA
MLTTLGLSLVIGLALGLLGGGGSILTVPMLVYVLHVEPKQAIVTSFVVVGLSSLMALISHARRNSVCWKSGFVFGLAGMFGAFGGSRLAVQFSSELLMGLFGLISLAIGLLMLRGQGVSKAKSINHQLPGSCPLQVPYLRVLFDGFLVGGLTAMVGVGGGFMIVPAMILLIGLPMQAAVGTSLLVIAMNAAAGLIGYSQHVQLDLELTGLVAAGTLLGSALGAWLSAYIRPEALRRIFAVMVILVAGYVLSQTLSSEAFSSLDPWLLDGKTLGKIIVGLLLLWLLGLVAYWVHKLDGVAFFAR